MVAPRRGLRAVVTLLLCSASVRAFAPSRRDGARIDSIGGASARGAAAPVAASVPPATSPPPPPRSVRDASAELVAALLDRRRGGAPRGGEARVRCLADFLAASGTSFDPAACLDGPLHVSHVVRGPRPLWERLGVRLPGGGGGGAGLQGQQYRYRGGEEADGGARSVANYAEVFGRDVHVRAYGTCRRDDAGPAAAAPAPTTGGRATGGVLGRPFAGAGRGRVTCPADFTVAVDRAEVRLWGRRFGLPISGTGYLRVLYADPRVRIFVSPLSTTDDRWEKAGLTVAQVRVDLVEGGSDFPDLFEE